MQAELEHAQKPIQLRTFLHHYWLSKYPFTTEKQLFRVIRDRVNALNVKEIVAELRADSTLYRGISEPDVLDIWSRLTADVKDSLYCISNTLNIQIANPLLLSVLRLYNAKKLKDGQVREIFSLVEKYHYTYTTICALPSSGGVSLMYAAHARDFANAPDSNELGICIRDFKKKVKDRVPARDIFISKFKQLNYLNARQRDVLRYTLWKIDRARYPALEVDRNSSSLEHLSSQVNHQYWTQYIGNLFLVPTRFNGEKLGTKSFLDKKSLLISGGYPLEPNVAGATTWNAQSVERRTQELAE